jgi:AraC-like DNA-binding protein
VLDLLDLELEETRPGGDLAADRLVDLLLVVALRTWLAQHPGPRGWWAALRDPVLGPALAALHAEPATPWTLASLGARVATSRSVLARRSAEVLGRPLMAYLTDWRMTLARELLADPEQTVEAVAAAVGCTSPYAFSTAFRRHHLVSPRAWRRGDAGEQSR